MTRNVSGIAEIQERPTGSTRPRGRLVLLALLVCGLSVAGSMADRGAQAQCNPAGLLPIRIQTFGTTVLQKCNAQFIFFPVPPLPGQLFGSYPCDAGGQLGLPGYISAYPGYRFFADGLDGVGIERSANEQSVHISSSQGNQTDLPYPCTVYSNSPWQLDINWTCLDRDWEVVSGTIWCGGRTFQVATDHCQNGIVGDDAIITETCDDGNNVEGTLDGCSTWCDVWPGWRCTGQPSSCSLLPCSDGVKTASEACDDGNTLSGDGCSNRCAIEPSYACAGSPSVCTTLCGNGVVNPGEQCDDGAARANGDGCSYFCQLEPETKTGNGGGFYPVTTDQNNDGLATASDPVETMVWTGSISAPVTITESGSPAMPAGYSALGVNVAITAPVATASAPLTLQFVYDVTLYPAALNVNNIAIKRNGVTVLNCTGAGATPNPCVESRTRLLPSNDVQIRVRTAQASDWGASVPLCGVFADDPKPQLIVTDDKLKVRGVFALPSDKSFADLAPQLRGAHVLVEGPDGVIAVDVALPPGDYAGKGTRGWSTTVRGSMWTYRDKTGTPINGITKLSIKDIGGGAAGGNVRVGVTGKHGTYDPATAGAPLHAVVDLGDAADAAAGLCGQTNATP